PPACGGEGIGVGGLDHKPGQSPVNIDQSAASIRISEFKIWPPPPTPPRHSHSLAEGGEARAAPVRFDLALRRYPAGNPLILGYRFASKLTRPGTAHVGAMAPVSRRGAPGVW